MHKMVFKRQKIPLTTVAIWAYSLLTHAALRIDPAPQVDLGIFPAESNQVVTFTLFNTTSNTLHITHLESCCFSLEPIIYEKSIPPGSSTPLDVLIDANTLVGQFEKSINLTTDEPGDQTRQIWIKGTALPAISPPPTPVFSGWAPLNQPWSTNLTLAVRSGLSGKLTATAQSNVGLSARIQATPGQPSLQLKIRPQSRPMHWQGVVYLQIEGYSRIPPVTIHLDGYFGSSLHPVPQKLQLAADGPAQASLKLFRKHPIPAPSIPTPLQCSIPTIGIDEVPGEAGSSTVTLTFPADFMRQLKIENRIPIELHAAGCIPITIPVEKL